MIRYMLVALLAGLVGGIFIGSKEVVRPRLPEWTAAQICQAATEVVKVQLPARYYYQLKYDSPEVRYDLTWTDDSSVIAIERLIGREFTPFAEQKTPEFTACVNSKPLVVIEAPH